MIPLADLPVPPLAHVLATMAYHVSSLMTDRPRRSDEPYCSRLRGGSGIGGTGGCPLVIVEYEIRPIGDDAERWGEWAQVAIAPMGQPLKHCGNRHGGREELVRLYAPVIEWVASYWAAAEQAKAA